MEITEYERLVSSETEALQSKMTMAIDAAMNAIQTKQSELMMQIRSDPRKSAIPKKSIKLVLQISSEQERNENERGRATAAREKFFATNRNTLKAYPKDLKALEASRLALEAASPKESLNALIEAARLHSTY